MRNWEENKIKHYEKISKALKKINIYDLSGEFGVCWNNQAQKWYARITVNKTTISLGLFDDLEKAKTARKEAETKYFKDFAYIGD